MSVDVQNPLSENGERDRRNFLKSAAGASAAGLLMGQGVSAASHVGPSPTVSKPQGFLLPYAENDAELGRQFLDDPEAFLEKRNIELESIACPNEVHEAFDVCDRVRASLQSKIKDGTVKTPMELARTAESMVKDHFGSNFQATLQPFGMRFQQRSPIYDNQVGFTVSGTVTITWLDSDADVDG